MHVHSLQHVPFEDLGSIQQVLHNSGHEITVTRLFEEHSQPEINEIDWLIVMGGPMGVHDEHEYPWLADEKRFIEKAIEKDKLVLGICLGAQLIAHVLGARVYANLHKEIGWFPVERTEAATSTSIGRSFSETVEAFHWHGDTFDLPHGAVHLARSANCENQAFVYRQRVVALQYHLETTRHSARALIENCSEELGAGPYVQSAESMMSSDARFAQINITMEALLDRLARQIV